MSPDCFGVFGDDFTNSCGKRERNRVRANPRVENLRLPQNNQHNADKNILESTVSTEWLAESDDFWHSLAISHLHTRDLFALYNDFYDSICLRNLRPTYPDDDIDRTNARALYRAYLQLAEQLDACTTALRRETQFARRLDLVAQIQQIQNQIHELPTQYATSQNADRRKRGTYI